MGAASQLFFSSILSSIDNTENGTMTQLLLIGGADLLGTGLSHESLEILNDVSQMSGLNVTTLNPDPWNEGPDDVVAQGAQYLKSEYQDGEKFFIYGYSMGGDAALQTARDLDQYDIPVALLITVDAAYGTSSVDRNVSSNVAINWNIYQTQANWNGSHGGPNTAEDQNSTVIINQNVTGMSFYDSYSGNQEQINHGNIDQYAIPSAVYLINYYQGH